MTNIYAAPKSDLVMPLEPELQRPISLFLLQAISTLILPFSLLIMVTEGVAPVRLRDITTSGRVSLGLAVWVGISLFLIVLIIGLQKRLKIARFAGLFCISLPVWGLLYYWLQRPPSVDSAEMWGRAFAMLMLMSPFFFWIYCFGFAFKAKVYFRLTGAAP